MVSFPRKQESSVFAFRLSLRGAKRRGNLSFLNMDNQYYVYILTNKNNSVLYTGVTNNLIKRVYERNLLMASQRNIKSISLCITKCSET